MKLLKSLWVLTTSIFLLVACREDSEIVCSSIPTLVTGEASTVTDVSATLTGAIEAPSCGGDAISQGFVYSKNTLPKVTDAILEVSEESTSIELSDLEQNTTYFYRVFYTDETTTYYGDEMSFTTTVGEVTFGTVEVFDITATSTQVTVKITGNGGADISLQGVCWSTNNEPTIVDAKTEEALGVDTFTSTLKDLAAATTYYVRSYATNESGTSYGEVKSFTTLDGVIKFDTSIVEEKTTTSVQVSFTLTDDGGAAVIVQGVCWSTSPNPTFYDDTYEVNYVSGMFTADLTGLQKGVLYYGRPYAINKVGTTYGEEFSFIIEKALEIGDTHAGGVVFYIADSPTDLDGDGDLDTGLVCATEEQSEAEWYTGIGINTEAIATDIGSGASNTDKIIEALGTGTYAASVARAYSGGGFNDWFLPSKDELNLMYTNLKSEGLGNFDNNSVYWSATEFNMYNAWGQDFNVGNQPSVKDKSAPNKVRAVRAF